jgi:hypothetical protein
MWYRTIKVSSRSRSAFVGPRRQRGSVIPLVAFAILFLFGMLAGAVDLARNLQCIRQLEFAAEQTAMYGLSQTTSQVTTQPTQSTNNISKAIQFASDSAWNYAQAGPVNAKNRSDWSKPVIFSGADVSFIPNPANPTDVNDVFLQLTDRREGVDALTRFFMPMLYAPTSFQGGKVSATARNANVKRTVEVISQPASRIGQGPPRNAVNGVPAAWAALPLAISNIQFQAASSTANKQALYTIDFVSTKTPLVQTGHIAGCLVNLTPTGNELQYYGDGQGANAYSQLDQSLQYFSDTVSGGTIAPGVVERGSKVAAFDPANKTFVAQQTQILKDLNGLVTPKQALHTFTVPVISQAPNFNGTSNLIIGFARMQLVSFTPSANGGFSAAIQIMESVPVRNASCANSLASVPMLTKSPMTPPAAPFQTRTYNPDTRGITPLPHGIAMAPSLSPRWTLGYVP